MWRQVTFVYALVQFILVVDVTSSLGAVFAVGEREESEIRSLVGDLSGFADDYRAAGATGVVHLDKSTLLDADGKSYRLVQSHVLHALDTTDEERATQSVFVMGSEEIRAARAWVLRAGGEFLRLGERDIRVDRSGKDGFAEVIFAFPQLHAGDTFAWSVRTEAKTAFYTREFTLDASTPVAFGRFVVNADGTMGYTVRAFNVPRDDFDMSVVEKKNGNPSNIVATYRGLRADRDEAMSPPWRQRRAHVVVSLKGILDRSAGMWIAVRSWNRIGAWSEETLERATKQDKKIRKAAEQIVEGLDDPLEKADALHRFVRDEIATLEAGETREWVEPEKTLENKAGDAMDKTGLLVAMLRSVDVPARLGLTRSRFVGKLQHRDPGFWQFTDMVALVEAGPPPGTWYSPGVDGCPVRTLPSHLRGVEVLFFQDDLEAKDEELLRRAYAKYGSHTQNLVRDWLERVRNATWYEIVETSGDFRQIVGLVDELRTLELESATASVLLTSQGITDLGLWARTGSDASECADRYTSRRGFEDEDLTEPKLEISEDGQTIQLEWKALVEPPVLTPDTWIVPASLVHGNPTFDFWQGPDRGPIFVASSSRFTTRTEIPIPEGWVFEAALESFEITNVLFRYEGRMFLRDDRVVIERSLDLKAGTVGEDAMELIDGDIRGILGFESQDLVVHPSDAPSPETARG